jgi:hypothetical protein
MALRMPDRLSFPFLQGSDLPVLIGEFGCARWAPGYLQFLSDLIDLIESWGDGWAFFDCREPSTADFGIYTGPPGVPTHTASISDKADVVDLLRRPLPAGGHPKRVGLSAERNSGGSPQNVQRSELIVVAPLKHVHGVFVRCH